MNAKNERVGYWDGDSPKRYFLLTVKSIFRPLPSFLSNKYFFECSALNKPFAKYILAKYAIF
jgi:hypothetical protein